VSRQVEERAAEMKLPARSRWIQVAETNVSNPAGKCYTSNPAVRNQAGEVVKTKEGGWEG